MRQFVLACLILAAPAAGAAQSGGRVVDVELTSFDFDPQLIRLRAGEVVTLRLVNRSSGGHNFAAPAFFAAARVAASDRALIEEGEVEVPSRGSVTIRLVPVQGSYRLRCTHRFHPTLGMRGRILVE